MEIKDVIKRAGKPLDRSKAIWKYCLECAGGNSKEVTLCSLVDCPLWPWRFGYKMSAPAFLARMGKQQEVSPDEFREAFTITEAPQDAPFPVPIAPQTHTAKKSEGRRSPYWEPEND